MVEPSEYIFALFGLILIIAFWKLALGVMDFVWDNALTIGFVVFILMLIISVFV